MGKETGETQRSAFEMADEESVVHFMEVTGSDTETAHAYILESKGSLEDAIEKFFSGEPLSSAAAGGKPAKSQGQDEEDAFGASPDAAALAMVQSSCHTTGSLAEEVKLIDQNGPMEVRVFLPYRRSGEKGAADTPLRFSLSQSHTLSALKVLTAYETNIPTVVLRCVFEGDCLRDNGATLGQLGMKNGRENKVLFLHPPRDERGPVEISDVDGKRVMLLKEGEWNVSTSITDLRKLVAKQMLGDVERAPSLRLVFNGLTVQDRTSFGLNGIAAGAVITALKQKGKAA